MHWFSGIDGHTLLRHIGWVWVVIVLLILLLIWHAIQLFLLWHGHEPMKLTFTRFPEGYQTRVGWAKGYRIERQYYAIDPYRKGIEICLWKYQLVWTWR